MSNSIEVTTKAGVKIAVNAVVGGNNGGGGVTAHADLTGLTTGDDHTQYQRSEATYTSSASYTVTDESTVITAGSAVTLADAEGMAGRVVVVGAAAQTVTVSPAGTDTMFDDPGNPYSLPAGNAVGFVAVQIASAWGWAVYTRNGPAFDMPKWFGESVAAGEVLRMGASAPEWTNEDPGAYDFLSGTGWTDNVPVVIPCKNTSAGTISKGQAVYVTGTVGATSVVEVALADCDDAAKMPAIGLAESTMAVNATGYVVVTGVLSGIDTSGFTINGPLYVSTTAGVLTGTKPTGTSELIQNIGRATRINASTGEVLVLGPGRTNDVPNAIDAGKLTSGTLDIARIADGAVTSAKIANGTIVDADVSASAAIATSKISGLGGAATLNVGTTTGTVAAGDDSRITGALQASNNLSDVTTVATGRSNLGVPVDGSSFVAASITSQLAETFNPTQLAAANLASSLTSGRVHLVGIWLPKGMTVANIAFCSGSTALATGTNQWFVLCNSSRSALRFTVNDTSTAWGASSVKTLALTSTYTTTYTGLHYVGVMVAATTPPTLRGLTTSVNSTGLLVESFVSDTGQTTPPAEGTTFTLGTRASAGTGGGLFWAGLS